MTAMVGTVGEVFEKPDGPVVLPESGAWWITRDTLGVDDDGNVTILIGDGKRVVRIAAPVGTLHRLADAINAQAFGAAANRDAGK